MIRNVAFAVLLLIPAWACAGTTASISESTGSAESIGSVRRSQAPGQVLVAKLEDEIINPVTARFVADAITEGEREHLPVVILLDTPGGLLQSTRELVKRILGSRVPVITFVYPNGARAASAGVFITYASHLAAMAPSTNIGAAHVVDITGRWPGSKRLSDDGNTSASGAIPDPLGTSGDVMNEKIMNDTLAWISAIARERGRNVEWARAAVSRSESITADEALSKNVIDAIAPDIPDLLRQIDGRKVQVAGGEYVLRTAGASPKYLELSTRQRILNMLANPNIAYILLLIGFAGLAYEITHPGLIAPGIVGTVSLLLAVFALQMLPTNYAAILLILAGIALIIAEIKFQSYGLLTLGGAACLFFGSLALFDQPGPFMGVSLSVILAVVVFIVGTLGMLVMLVIRAHSHRPVTGVSSYIGGIAEVSQPLNPEGKVFFNGSYWNAVCTTPLPRGAKVRVVAVDRLRLVVEPDGTPPHRPGGAIA